MRILGTFASERTLDTIQNHLQTFGMNQTKHCVASVTDRTAVLANYGRISKVTSMLLARNLFGCASVCGGLNLNERQEKPDVCDS